MGHSLGQQQLLLSKAKWGYLKVFLSIFGLLAALLASLAALANDWVHWGAAFPVTSTYLFLYGLLLALLPKPWGLMGIIAFLPLSAGLHTQLSALTGIEFLPVLNVGLDLVAGLFLGTVVHIIFSGDFKKPFITVMPWPVGLVSLFITASVLLSIFRNLHLSASAVSSDGFIFNLIHFRPIDWQADFLPMRDWIAYSIASAMVALVAWNLQALSERVRNAVIFRPLLVGLVFASIVGLIQSFTGFGLVESNLDFRKDAFGYAAIGLQPDLHAFAAHMLLGVVGLWGYYWLCQQNSQSSERKVVLAIIILSIIGLIASKSRASLFFGLSALCIGWVIFSYQQWQEKSLAKQQIKEQTKKQANKKSFLLWTNCFAVSIFVGISCSLLFFDAKALSNLGWFGPLVEQIKKLDLTSLSAWSGLLGSRIEIWAAALRMFFSYPLLGIGQGEFYRLSSNPSFSRSYFLEHYGGENAHNYFLQTLTETGLIGCAVFLLAFLYPWFKVLHRQQLYPAVIALMGLFLGNLFAHAFLVRENLLLGAVLLGLMYSWPQRNKRALSNPSLGEMRSGRAKNMPWYGYGLIGLLILGTGAEIISSFYRLPFYAGNDCYKIAKSLSDDGWTSGAWEERIPRGAKGITLDLTPNRPIFSHKPLRAKLEFLSWEAGKGKLPVASQSLEWSVNESSKINLLLPEAYINSPNVISARLELSSCYTPRNLGISTDSRRLGVQMKPPLFW